MWKLFGSCSLSSGSLSAAAAVGGGPTGAIFVTASPSGRPCAHDGGGVGWAAAAGGVAGAAGAAGAGCAGDGGLPGCCAATGRAIPLTTMAVAPGHNVRECDRTLFLSTSLGGAF